MSIYIDSISKTFVTSFTRKKKTAVQAVSLNIRQGEILGIIGPNGAGKSTLLKMLMGFIRPNEGKILLAGKSPSDPESRASVGYLPENPYYYDYLSARELMRFSAQAAGMSAQEIEPRIDLLLNQVGLQSAGKRKMRSYSKGMTQRAGLSFALVHDPEIVVLDEPMSGLDPLGRKMVVDLILDLKKSGKTVLFCSHILSDVERICDRMAIMAHGRLQKTLEKKELVEESDQTRIFVDFLSPGLNRQCQELNCVLETEGDHTRIECRREQLSQMLTVCQEENINILSIDNTTNTLEQVFLKTIEEAAS